MTLVVLDFHKARKTCAQTFWFAVQYGKPVPLSKVGVKRSDTWRPDKTHWEEIWEIPVGVRLVRVRISNRGNKNVEVYEVGPAMLELKKRLFYTEAELFLAKLGVEEDF